MLVMYLYFLYIVLLPRLPSIFNCHYILYHIVSDEGTHFTARELHQWEHSHEIHSSYYISHHTEAICLIESCNGLL